MPSLGPAEILVILVIALLVFGPEKMPEIARQVGKGMREFKRVQQHLRSELRDVVAEFDAPSATESGGSDPLPTFPPKDDVVAPDAALPPSPDHPISPEVTNPEVMIPDPIEPEPLSPPPPDLAPAPDLTAAAPPPPTDAMNGNGNGTAPNPGTADSGTPAEPA